MSEEPGIPTDPGSRNRSYILLCVSLIVVAVVFAVRAKYDPGVYYAIAGVQFAVTCFAGWKLGAWAIGADALERRWPALAGVLLVMPLVLLSFLPGVGPPGGQTAAENQLRYLILLIDAMAIAGGLIVLREVLSAAGERFYSTLGFVTIMLATSPYLIWASLMIQLSPAMERSISGEASPPWIRWMADLADILLFFGGVLTFMAAAAFAMSLGQIQWLGRRSTRAYLAASVLAVLFLAIRGFLFPDPSAIQWYEIPGFVAGIPAVPWIMPCILGISLLRRAGNAEVGA